MKKFLLPLALISACALLSGCFPSGIHGDHAKTSGVGNNLTVSTEWNDSRIKSAVFSAMNKIPALNSGKSNVELSVYNRQVLLVGQVQTSQVHRELRNAIDSVKGVSKVYDYLRIGPQISKGNYSKDGWITSKVAASFVGDVNPLHFKVVTESGVVYLMGVTTRTEGDTAESIASKVNGVKRVVPILTYIPKEK